MADPIPQLRGIDERISEELSRSGQTLKSLIRERETIVRDVCAAKVEGVSDVILEFATRRAPAQFTPTEVYLYVKDRLGPAVTKNLVNAWLTKLVRSRKLRKLQRGIYVL